MSKRDQIICSTPASCYNRWYRDGLPCGNGKIGLLVHGGIEEETILINHSQLWHWGKNTPVPDVSNALAETRNLIDQGDYLSADSITSQALLQKGYDSMLFKPCPLADLKVTIDNCSPFSNYSRVLHMDKAEAEVEWHFQEAHFQRKYFASRKKDLFVVCQACEGKTSGGTIALRLHQSYGPDTLRMEQETKESLTITSANDYIYYAFQNDDGKDCGIVLKVIGDGKLFEVSDGSIRYENMHSMLMIGMPFVGEKRTDAFQRLHKTLSNLEPDYKKLLKEHVSVHKKLYKGSEIVLSDGGFGVTNERMLLNAYETTPSNAMLEKLWRYGKYLFICATGEDGLPMPLYGLWHGEYDAVWSHNMANINIQMIYWHSFQNNLLSMNKAFIDYYYGLMEQFRENAKQLFGMRGIYLSAGSTPGFGRINQVVPVITNWVGAAGWIATHFYKYYLYTKDKIYLMEKILPFMIEAAEFYEDYLVVSESGELRCYPSVSPENTPGNLMPKDPVYAMNHACPTSENATMDFAIIKELFSNLLALADEAEIDEGKVCTYKRLLAAIPEYQFNEDGSLKEWMKSELTENHFHRHISHLYPVFPGEEIDADTQPKLAKGCLKVIENRELGGQTGWSFCHTACVLTRLQQPEKAMEFMEIMARSCLTNSFLSMHNDWRKMGMSLNLDKLSPIQLDANMGFVAAVQEMLFSVVGETIKILPALPKRFEAGKVRGFTAPGAEVDFSWSKEGVAISIAVKAKSKLKIKLPKQYEKYRMQYPDEVMCGMNKGLLEIDNPTMGVIEIHVGGTC